jgi:hypothetical protein
MTRCTAFLTILALGLGTATVSAQTTVLKDPATGTPALKSIECISFTPSGVLLIGDGKGKQIVAVDTRDTTPAKWTRTEIKNIKDELAGRLGVTSKDIEIVKVAVNPASNTAYIAVRGLTMKKDLILTVDGYGKISEFKMDAVPFVAIPLPSDVKVTKVTDITWAGDRVLVAAQASDTFSSKIFSVMAPLAKDGSCTAFSTETYHVAHGRWETNAPIRTIIPYEMNGKKYLVGTFTCTPIVKYSLDAMQAGAKVKGVSVIELGNGNTPQSMFTYEKGGKSYILMNQVRMEKMQKNNPVGPSEYWTARVDYSILKEDTKINENAELRYKGKDASKTQSEFVMVCPEYHGVMMMDKLDAERALVIRKDAQGAVNLQVLPLP